MIVSVRGSGDNNGGEANKGNNHTDTVKRRKKSERKSCKHVKPTDQVNDFAVDIQQPGDLIPRSGRERKRERDQFVLEGKIWSEMRVEEEERREAVRQDYLEVLW